MYLSTVSGVHTPRPWRTQWLHTQELSEIDSIRGAKVEVGILGVEVPLTDGVFSPCATVVSEPASQFIALTRRR